MYVVKGALYVSVIKYCTFQQLLYLSILHVKSQREMNARLFIFFYVTSAAYLSGELLFSLRN